MTLLSGTPGFKPKGLHDNVDKASVLLGEAVKTQLQPGGGLHDRLRSLPAPTFCDWGLMNTRARDALLITPSSSCFSLWTAREPQIWVKLHQTCTRFCLFLQ